LARVKEDTKAKAKVRAAKAGAIDPRAYFKARVLAKVLKED
jgi:hypothetical protein